ncbi:MAG TPA: ABC transporter substrate-binding protein [Candidatus Lustribacter sp.]|jgi:NitT/TauT family transport system substrate-binding protein|nr:ABC transporter substrate-binding protein [Candidatus Lustribacter sp.]
MKLFAFTLLTLALGAVSSAPVQSATPLTINVISLPSDTAGTLYYADELGYFKAAGLDVKITDMTASPPIVAAVASGAGDIGFSVVTSTAVARERGIPVRFIAPGAMWLTVNGTAQLVVAKDSTLQSGASFNGKTIAVTGLADLTYYGTKAWLDKNGCDTSTVKWVELPFPQMAAAVAQHRVDGAMIAEPFLEASKPLVKFVAPVDDAVAPRFMSTGWIATDAWIKAHPVEAAKFAEVMIKTAAWANTHQKESAQILLHHTQITPETAASMSRVAYATSLDPKLLQPSIDTAAKYSSTPMRDTPASELIWRP